MTTQHSTILSQQNKKVEYFFNTEFNERENNE